MTRTEILRQYDVDSAGVIRSPGKFEGEYLYAPYFWDLFLEGCTDEDDGDVLRFNVTEKDRMEFPELVAVQVVTLTECEQGFVYCSEE